MSANDAKKSIQKLLNKSKFGLTKNDITNASELIHHGEYGVAFELICTQLYEHDAKVSEELMIYIEKTALTMGLDKSSWSFLKENVKLHDNSSNSALDDELSFNSYEALKSQGESPDNAITIAKKEGMTTIKMVMMLRSVYGLSFEESSKILKK